MYTLASRSNKKDGENVEFVQIGVLEAEFDKCRKKLFGELQKAHDRIAELDKEVNQKSGVIVNLNREVTEQKDNFAKNIASKEERLRILSLEVNAKHTKNNELKKENYMLKRKYDKEIKYLQTLNVEHKKNIERLNDHIKKMNIDMKNLSCKHRKKTEQLEYDLNETRHAFTCKENEIKIRSTELDTLETEKRKLCELVKMLTTEVNNLKSTQEQLKQSADKGEEEKSSEITQTEGFKEAERKLEEAEQNINALTQSLDNANRQVDEAVKLRDEAEERLIQKVKEHAKLCEDNWNFEKENLHLKEKLKKSGKEQKEIYTLQKTINTQKQNQELMKNKHQAEIERLRKIAGANLTLKTPDINIADLSDDKRPTRLAEEFSELYDNEWTDAFEVMEIKDDRDKTTYMLFLLQRASDICCEISDTHIHDIKKGLCHMTFRTKSISAEEGTNSITEPTVNECQERKNNKQSQSDEDFIMINIDKTNENSEQDSDELKTQQGNAQIPPKFTDVTDTSTQTDSEKNPTQLHQSVLGMTVTENKQAHTDASIDITTHDRFKAEHNVNQSVSGESEENGNGDDKQTDQNPKVEYSELVNEIKFDFDSLRNDQKKTVMELRKFIEINVSHQIEKDVANAIVAENKIDDVKDEMIVKYIKKCVNVCWSMCRHEPPVHIEFPDIQGDQKFDSNVFKPYTKSVKHLQYVVWPALYLHKDGPMLSKGVAQGR